MAKDSSGDRGIHHTAFLLEFGMPAAPSAVGAVTLNDDGLDHALLVPRSHD